MENKESHAGIAEADATEQPIVDETIDVDALVAGVERLAKQYPNWEDHLPLEAAIDYNADSDYQKEYGDHVESCEFCQRLIETYDPPAQALAAILEQIAVDKIPSTDDKKEEDSVTQAIINLVNRLFGPDSEFEPLPAPSAPFAHDVLVRPGMLEVLGKVEHSENPIDKFCVADLYLKCHKPRFAYKALGEGLRLWGLDESIAGRISDAPAMILFNSDSLTEIANELQSTLDENSDPVRRVELSAKAGKHSVALHSICDIVDGVLASKEGTSGSSARSFKHN